MLDSVLKNKNFVFYNISDKKTHILASHYDCNTRIDIPQVLMWVLFVHKALTYRAIITGMEVMHDARPTD